MSFCLGEGWARPPARTEQRRTVEPWTTLEHSGLQSTLLYSGAAEHTRLGFLSEGPCQ